jgi:two-component system NarL family response regulator
MTESYIDRASIGAPDDPARPAIRVLIALGVPFLRTGVRKVLDEAENLEVIGEVSSRQDVVSATDRLEPDITVLDSDFQRADPGLVQAIREARPSVGVVVMVNHSDDDCVIRAMLADPDGPQFSDEAIAKLSECCLMALRSSARGCVPKVAEPDRLVRAIRTVAAGGLAAGGWLGSMVGRMSDATPEAGRVTGRELEIISLVARGLENKEIAAELEIAEQTVKNHLSRVMKKLGLRNRQEVAMFAIRVHLDTPG